MARTHCCCNEGHCYEHSFFISGDETMSWMLVHKDLHIDACLYCDSEGEFYCILVVLDAIEITAWNLQ